jgi:hypothetical protein
LFVEIRGYCGDGDGGIFFPSAGIGDGDGEKFGGRGGEQRNSLRTFPAQFTSLGSVMFHS